MSRYTAIAIRSHAELNVKQSAYEQLFPYSADKDAYISFTQIDKLGINPKSHYNTPLGIYTYPLETVWEYYDISYYKTLKRLPFAAENPYIHLVKSKTGHGFVNDLYLDYTESRLKTDIEKCQKLFYSEYSKLTDDQVSKFYQPTKEQIDNYRQRMNEALAVVWKKQVLEKGIDEANHPWPCSHFWNITRTMADRLCDSKKVHSTADVKATKWNWILRQLGYTGFADKSGKGIIHPSEPMQAVFLSSASFTRVKEVMNKDYVPKDNVVKTIHDIPNVENVNNTELMELCLVLLGIKSKLPSNLLSKVQFYKNNPLLIFKQASGQEIADFMDYLMDDLGSSGLTGAWLAIMEKMRDIYDSKK